MGIIEAIMTANLVGGKGEKLAYTESKTISWDGDTSGKLYFDGFGCKVSNEDIDLTQLVSVTVITQGGFKSEVLQYLDISIGDEISTATTNGGDSGIIIVVHQDLDEEGVVVEKGTYFYHGTDLTSDGVLMWTSSVTTEVIHPIDPKYIPGAVLPVVEIATEIVSDTPVSLSDSESERLDEVASLVTPINVIVSIAEGVVMSLPCYFAKSGEQLIFQSMMPQETNVYLLKQGETWRGLYGSM